MPTPFPREFRDQVVARARARERGTTLRDIAAQAGISETCLHNWLRRADAASDASRRSIRRDADELRDAQRRIRLLERENAILRRAAAHVLTRGGREPTPKRSTRSSESWPPAASPSR